MCLGRIHNVESKLSAVACQEKGLLIWFSCDVFGWSCGRLERANRQGTHRGAAGDCHGS